MCVCVCGCAHRGSLLQLRPQGIAEMWGAPGGTSLPRASKRFPKGPGAGREQPCLCWDARRGAWPAGQLVSKPPKQAFTRSDPIAAGRRLSGCPGVFFSPSRDTCFPSKKNNKTCRSELCKCALEAENKVSCRAGASLRPAPAVPGSFAMALSSPKIWENSTIKIKEKKKSPVAGCLFLSLEAAGKEIKPIPRWLGVFRCCGGDSLGVFFFPCFLF